MGLAARLEEDYIVRYRQEVSDDTDVFGNEVYEDAVGVQYPAWVNPVQRQAGAEINLDRQVRIEMVRVTLPPEHEGEPVDVLGTDEIEWDGRRWEVLGEPSKSKAKHGEVHHIHITLQRELG